MHAYSYKIAFIYFRFEQRHPRASVPTWHLLFYVKVCLQKNNHRKGNPLLFRIIQILDKVNRGYYMAAWGYEFYL